MKAKMTVYQNGGKMATGGKKKMTDMEIAKANRMDMLTQERNTIKKYDPDALAAFDRKLKQDGYMVTKKPVAKKYEKGGKMNVAGAKGEDQYKYLGYGKGGKMPVYSKGGMMKYLKGGQVKLDKNMDGKITGADFKMMAKKK